MGVVLLRRRREDRRIPAIEHDPEKSLRRGKVLSTVIRRRSSATALALGALACVSFARAAELPAGFVFLRDVAPGIRQDIRYAGAHNFLGRPAAGYLAGECVLTRRAAEKLARAQAVLARGGLSLIVWDCYRPARAVADFVEWTGDAADTRMKAEFYPRTEKPDLVPFGYISARSAHAAGSTVDLGLMAAGAPLPAPWSERQPLVDCAAAKGERFDDGTVDLGTGFDCLDERASFDDPEVSDEARRNRAILRNVMVRLGFKPYVREWWHFRLAAEPFPDRMFDFPIPPRRR